MVSKTDRNDVSPAQNHPLVSIVTPSYNQGRFIEETIQSVLNQNYPNLEYLVVDGGSTDETLAILKRYSSHLTWISEKDDGQADAINKGFQRAKGEILSWINSDDTYLPGAIERVVEFFRMHPDVDLVYGKGYYVDVQGAVLGAYPTESFTPRRLREVCFICQPAAFFRAEAFRAIGPLNVRLIYCLDYEYWIRATQRCRAHYLDSYLATSRLHETAKTVAGRAAAQQEACWVVRKYYGYVPMSWIRSYTYFRLLDAVMPNLYGVKQDGKASRRVQLVARKMWGRLASVQVQGVAEEKREPLRLRVIAGSRTLQEMVCGSNPFSLTAQIPESEGELWSRGQIEVQVLADSLGGSPEETEQEASYLYGVEKILISDMRQKKIVLYSHLTKMLFFVGYPLLFGWSFIWFNCWPLPWKEGKSVID